MANSKPTPSSRKSPPVRPSTPADFPLRIHKGTGYWCKKIRKRVHYFGKVADDPEGKAALTQYLEEKDDLEAGRLPRNKDPEAITVADLCNQYLDHQEGRRDRGEISPRTFQCLHGACANIVKVFRKTRAVSDLKPADFGNLKDKLSETRGAVALRNEMQRVRGVFRFAFVNGLIDREVQYGSKFDKPPLKQTRREKREHKAQHGERMFEAAEIRAILAEAKHPLRTMVLLAINCGMGQSDLANLPVSAIDLDNEIVDYPRPKTEASRLCPLWPETAQAIREWLPNRPKAKSPTDSGLLFLTVRGNKFVKAGKNGSPIDGIGQEFGKVIRKLGLQRSRRGFYALRHSFRTIADETLDPAACNLIMGHVDGSMAANYRERIGKDRLRRVAEHVRSWLFDDSDSPPEGDGKKLIAKICDPIDPCDPAEVAGNESGSHGPHGSQNRGQSICDDDRPALRLFVG